MEPVLAVFAGYSLAGEVVKPGPELEPYVEEALDEIEYVTGGTDTSWGARRAHDGHPPPFPLRYVEIGNEDGFDKAKTYNRRFAHFYKAIKAKHPNLQVIATIPVKGTTPDVMDDHYYKREPACLKNPDITTVPTAPARRFLWASGPPGKARQPRTLAARSGMQRS